MEYLTRDPAEAAFLITMNETCSTIVKSRCIEGPVDMQKLQYDRLAEDLFGCTPGCVCDLNLNVIDEFIRIR
jgi:hypothetical protein